MSVRNTWPVKNWIKEGKSDAYGDAVMAVLKVMKRYAILNPGESETKGEAIEDSYKLKQELISAIHACAAVGLSINQPKT